MHTAGLRGWPWATLLSRELVIIDIFMEYLLNILKPNSCSVPRSSPLNASGVP